MVRSLTLVTVGKPQLDYACEGLSFYDVRLRQHVQFEIKAMRDNVKCAEELQREKHRGSRIFGFDEKGKRYTSRSFSKTLDELAIRGTSHAVFVIGGPDGLSTDMRACCDAFISLSDFTFPHDLAQVMAAEMLYRSVLISKGHPYHRG